MHRIALVPSLALALALAGALIAVPGLAAAEPTGPGRVPAAHTPTPLTVGARVGGYGFRRPGAVDVTGHVAWDDCRMNGVGMFARRPVGRLFAEAGADLYFAETFPIPTTHDDHAMDRMSGLLTVAIGADLVHTRRFVGYAQLGAGLELTRVSMTKADGEVLRDQRALPLGFVGFGGELRLGARTALGASLRTHVMGHFDHDEQAGPAGAAALATGTADGGLDASPEIAAQGQFYVSYQL